MSTEGVDYSMARPSPAALYAAGKRFVVRYGGPGSASKHLSAAEARSLSAAGLAIVANAEGSAGGFTGRAAGVSWATSADAAFRAIGMPAGRPIYFSVDWNVSAAQWPGVVAALKGAADVIGLGRVGIYGGLQAVQWAQRDRVASWFWQTYAWSGGKWAAGTHIQQYRNAVTLAGADVDLDRAIKGDYGQWGVSQPADPPPALVDTGGVSAMYFSITDGTKGGPPVGKDCDGVDLVHDSRVIATPKGIKALEYGTIIDAFTAYGTKMFLPISVASLQQICDAMRQPAPTITIPDNADEIIAGVLQGMADNPDSPATQADVDRVIAAIQANPEAVRQAFRDAPLS